ncbi:MAG: hypothetical protein DMG14_25060 [Acidobacteria bacterium]|nr:MAG: hypothetical protein DMG14_25060 [Acidobacteriota bacterium]
MTEFSLLRHNFRREEGREMDDWLRCLFGREQPGSGASLRVTIRIGPHKPGEPYQVIGFAS